MDAEKRAQAPENGAFNAAPGHRTRPNFVGGWDLQSAKRVSFFNFRMQLVRRIQLDAALQPAALCNSDRE
jgi:hypothetical protein